MADQLMAADEPFDQSGAVTVSLNGIVYNLPLFTSPESASDYQAGGGGTRAYGFVA